jgi:hypothetical protein
LVVIIIIIILTEKEKKGIRKGLAQTPYMCFPACPCSWKLVTNSVPE